MEAPCPPSTRESRQNRHNHGVTQCGRCAGRKLDFQPRQTYPTLRVSQANQTTQAEFLLTRLPYQSYRPTGPNVPSTFARSENRHARIAEIQFTYWMGILCAMCRVCAAARKSCAHNSVRIESATQSPSRVRLTRSPSSWSIPQLTNCSIVAPAISSRRTPVWAAKPVRSIPSRRRNCVVIVSRARSVVSSASL